MQNTAERLSEILARTEYELVRSIPNSTPSNGLGFSCSRQR